MDIPDISLTAPERAALELAMARVRRSCVRRRILGVLLVGSGQSLTLAAANAGLTPDTLATWVSRYAGQRTPEALAPSASRRGSYMRSDRVRRLVEDTVARPPESFGYAAREWNPALLRIHLASAERLRLPRPVLERLLARG
jgi:transposase